MSQRRFAVWDAQGQAAQLAQWRAALVAAAGNVTRAGEAMGFTKSWAMRLTRRLKLNDFAAELRRAALGRKTDKGRPWDEGGVGPPVRTPKPATKQAPGKRN